MYNYVGFCAALQSPLILNSLSRSYIYGQEYLVQMNDNLIILNEQLHWQNVCSAAGGRNPWIIDLLRIMMGVNVFKALNTWTQD